jgi:hypothetical protein
MRALLSVVCLLSMTACGEDNPIGPRLPLNEQFRLAPGEVAQFEGATPRLQFVGVTSVARSEIANRRPHRSNRGDGKASRRPTVGAADFSSAVGISHVLGLEPKGNALAALASIHATQRQA